MRRFLTGSVRWLVALVVLAITGWGALALAVVGPGGDKGRLVLAAVFGVAGLAAVVALVLARGLRVALPVFAVALVAAGVWWRTIEPSNERDWAARGRAPAARDLDGDRVTVHNIRNFDYRSETDFTPRYYDRTFDLRKLDAVDLFAVYWMGPAIAHMILSFGFGGEHSRSRSRRGRSGARAIRRSAASSSSTSSSTSSPTSATWSGVRTNYRRDPPEDVYLYRAAGPAENARRLLPRVRSRDQRAATSSPEFYNTLTTNCTDNIVLHTPGQPGAPAVLSWKILASGYAAGVRLRGGPARYQRCRSKSSRSEPGSTRARRRRTRRRISRGASAPHCPAPPAAERMRRLRSATILSPADRKE